MTVVAALEEEPYLQRQYLAGKASAAEEVPMSAIGVPPSEADKDPKPQHPMLKYNVELRAEDALRLEYSHALNLLTADTGVLITFASPGAVPLPVMKVYTPVDALFVAENGTVVQILPNVTLGEITQTLTARLPVKAFLFLKAGEAARRGIHPRDVVTCTMFTPAPSMQEELWMRRFYSGLIF